MLAEGGLEPLWLFRVKRFSEPLHFRLGNLVASVFRPVLAKHTKHLSLVDILPIGADRMQRSFEPMRKKWRRGQERASRTSQPNWPVFQSTLGLIQGRDK